MKIKYATIEIDKLIEYLEKEKSREITKVKIDGTLLSDNWDNAILFTNKEQW